MFNEALAGKHGGNHNPEGINQHTAGLRQVKSNNVTLDQNKQHRNTHGNSKGYTSRHLLKERHERLGELLKDMPKAKGASAGGKKESPRGSYLVLRDNSGTLSDLGISKKLSSKCQRLAAARYAIELEREAKERQKAVGTANLTGKPVSIDTDLEFGRSREVAAARYAIELEREAKERQGTRTDLTSASNDANVEFGRSREIAAEKFNESPATDARAVKVVKEGADTILGLINHSTKTLFLH